jgi:hypothetical protein
MKAAKHTKSRFTEMPDAIFVSSGTEPEDAPMWPLSAALWLQPEMGPSIPAWSGLAIERHFGIPSPDFLHPECAPFDRSEARSFCDILRRAATVKIPESDLTPLGWDPRSVRKGL